jgi:hypothetical protein
VHDPKMAGVGARVAEAVWLTACTAVFQPADGRVYSVITEKSTKLNLNYFSVPLLTAVCQDVR